MKQHWRVREIRVLLSLALGMFVLGKLYQSYVPFLADMGLIGAIILGGFLTLFFLGLGWAYDAKAKMWSQKMQAAVERDPYYYVPSPSAYAINYPFLYGLLHTLKNILKSEGIESSYLDESIAYFSSYYARKPERRDISDAKNNAEWFLNKHPFLDHEGDGKESSSVSAKAKLASEVTMLRLIWIQSLTAMIFDALVFGALFVTLIFPNEVVGNIVPINYLLLGILFLSVPIYIVVALLGWYYDRRLKAWSASSIVRVQRNPYQYVPPPNIRIYSIPAFFTIFQTLRDVFDNQQLDTQLINSIIDYLIDFNKLSVTRDDDMEKARELRASFSDVFQLERTVLK